MQDHAVELTVSNNRTSLRFAPVFNVAVPFIDRHLDEGRGGKVIDILENI